MKRSISQFSDIASRNLHALVRFTPGLGEIVRDELLAILADPWIPEKNMQRKTEIRLFPEKITIHNISLQGFLAINERSYIARDAFITLAETFLPSIGKCQPLLIPKVLEPAYLASQFLPDKPCMDCTVSLRKSHHTPAEILDSFWSNYPIEWKSLTGTAPLRVHLDIVGEKLSYHLTWNSKPLYRRGFRVPLSHSAPLSEDIAASLIRFRLLSGIDWEKTNAFIPFSGTGTLAFELFTQANGFPPRITEDFSLSSVASHLDPKNWSSYLQKKWRNRIANRTPHHLAILCTDTHRDAVENSRQNLLAYRTRLDEFLPDITETARNKWIPNIDFQEADFFKWDISPKAGSQFSLFLLNPPYGKRVHRHQNNAPFFREISQKIESYREQFPKQTIRGFLLCPDEASYFSAREILSRVFSLETLHFSQGVLSLRALFFSSPV